MTRISKIGLFLIIGFITTLSTVNAQPAKTPKYNVLFLICDDLNCDLGCYGHPLVQSPNIDRLAKAGMRFERAYCQYPLCGPSRASFMTGLYPTQTLITANSIYIRQTLPDVTTLSQLFRNHGYTSSRIGKIYHYNVPKAIGTPGHDDPASWTQTFNPIGRDKDDEESIFSLKPGQFGATLSWLAAEGEDIEQTDGIGANEAIKQLEQFAQDKTPFYLAVGLYRPHTPYVAPKKYFDLYPLDQIKVPTIPQNYYDTVPAPARNALTRHKEEINLADHLARQAIRAYYASTTFADAQLGRILDTLRQTGLDKNTIILFTSDHGYHLGEHGHYQKMSLYDNATHVPLIISVPGMKTAGQSTPALAQMIDFYPTLAELCNLPAPAYLSGHSLVPTLKNPAIKPRKAALTQMGNNFTIRTDHHRYTEWGPNAMDGAELYDTITDLAEMKNLIDDPDQKSTITELKTLLHQQIQIARQTPDNLKQTPLKK